MLSRLERARRRALETTAQDRASTDGAVSADEDEGAEAPALTLPADASAAEKLLAITRRLSSSGATRAKVLVALGVSRQHLSYLVDRGVIVRLRHGLYALPERTGTRGAQPLGSEETAAAAWIGKTQSS